MADVQIPGLPAGAVLQDIPAQQTQPAGLPAGAVLKDIPPPNQQQQPTTLSDVAQTAGKVVGSYESGLVGAVKEAGQTVAGVSSLINKIPGVGETLAPKEGINALEQQTQLHGVGEHVGAVVEQAGEWALGDEAVGALGDLAKASKYLKTPGMLAAYLQKSPKVAAALEAISHGMIVGGAQGAVQGAAHGDTTGGAVRGAVGGGAGAGVAEGLTAGVPALAKILGLGGLSMEENITKAAGGSLNVGTQNWDQSLKQAMPLLAEANKTTPIKTVGDFEDLAHNTAQTLWQHDIAPQIARHPQDVIPGQSVTLKLQNAVTDEMKDLFPDEAKQIEEFAKKFDKDIPLPKAQSYLELLNAKLKGYYKLTPDARHALGVTDGAISAYENAADGLRDEICKKLGPRFRELRQQYGALKEVQRVFGKRATVADRQAPLDFKQVIGLIAGGSEAAGAVAMGHPLAAVAGVAPVAIATAAKMRNAPASLIKQGLRQAAEAAAPSATKAAISEVAPKASAMAGSQAAQWVRFLGTDNKEYTIHPEDLAEAKARGLVKDIIGQ